MLLSSVLVPAWPPDAQCKYQYLIYHWLYDILLLQKTHTTRIFKSASLFEENNVGGESRSVSTSQEALGVTEKEFVLLFKTSPKNHSTFLEEAKENARLNSQLHLSFLQQSVKPFNCWDCFWIDNNKGQFSNNRKSLTKEIFILGKEEVWEESLAPEDKVYRERISEVNFKISVFLLTGF